MRVDLPAPFSPTRAFTSPARTSNVTSSRARTPGKDFETRSARRITAPSASARGPFATVSPSTCCCKAGPSTKERLKILEGTAGDGIGVHVPPVESDLHGEIAVEPDVP